MWECEFCYRNFPIHGRRRQGYNACIPVIDDERHGNAAVRVGVYNGEGALDTLQ